MFRGTYRAIAGEPFSSPAGTAPHHQITFWHVPTGRELLTINPGFKLIRSLEFSSDGRWLVAAGQNLNGYGEVVLLRGRADE